MTDFLRAVSPFLLALYLLFDGTRSDAGAKWFKDQSKRDLTALGVSDADRHVDDLWENARIASAPGALAVRALVTVVGLYLLLPSESSTGWLFGLALFVAALGSIRLGTVVKPRAELHVGHRNYELARALSVLLVGVGLVAAVLKTIIS